MVPVAMAYAENVTKPLTILVSELGGILTVNCVIIFFCRLAGCALVGSGDQIDGIENRDECQQTCRCLFALT